MRYARLLWLGVAGAALMACADNAPGERDMTDRRMGTAAAALPVGDNPLTDIDIDALLADMTLDEKLAQISCVWRDKADIFTDDGDFDPDKMAERFPHGIGCFARPQDTMGVEDQGEMMGDNDATVVRTRAARSPAQTVELTNAVQRWHIENTRLGIPTLFHEEGLHGFQARDATSFPQALALAATFDPDMAEDIYTVVAREIRARGAHHVLSPVVDVARDPRWGRIEETFGEDPYLVSRMGVAAVKGFQGDGFPVADDRVVATLKHMTGHGQPEAGMNVGPAQISERVLREVFFPPFEAAIEEANAATVMASYNEIDGIPSHASDWLLTDVLRGEWGFDGAVVADYFAINELQNRHAIVDNLSDAGALALRAGVDIELPDGVAYFALKEQVEAGEFPVEVLDRAVRRTLLTKARANVWATPYSDADAAEAATGREADRALAREAAQKATILLKNNGVLPLAKDSSQTIAVIGPNSDITVLGGYSDDPKVTVSLLDGMREVAGERIVHSKGVTLTDNRSWWDDDVNLIDPEENRISILQAVRAARSADVIVVAVGGDESTSREAWSESHGGDRDDITLIGEQVELIEALAELDKPMVGVVLSGRPLALTDVQDHFDALLYGFLLGQETGGALADVLFGDVSPSGRLPVTLPRNVGQLPVFYNTKPTARRGYAFSDSRALYPFGFGLSYTTFEYGEPRMRNADGPLGGGAQVSVDVTNTGDMSADEVVQVYVRDDVASVTRRVKELKGFQRVSLAPGETKTVTIDIAPRAFEFFDRDMNRVAELGTFTIMVGPNSDDLKTTTFTLRPARIAE